MSGEMVAVTAVRRGLRRTEPMKKLPEVSIPRKMATLKSKKTEKPNEIRSPLIERSNKVPQKKSAAVKVLDQKSIKPINKENIRPVVNKDGKTITITHKKTITISQSFLKTKTLKERELKDGKQKEESAKADQKPAVKPVLGAYRGKIVQSKINSFRQPSRTASDKSAAPELKTIKQRAATKPNIPAPRKPIVRPSSVNDMKPKPKVLPVTSQVKTSTTTTIKTKVQPGTTRRATHVIPTATLQTKASSTAVTKSKVSHVTIRRTTHIPNHNKSLGANVPQEPEVQKKGSDLAGMQSKKRVTIGPVSIIPSHQRPSIAGKYPRVNETTEERKARLAQWRASKGKVMKRPPSMAPLSTFTVQKDEPVIKSEPEEPKEEEPRQLFWATMAEEDEQEWFTLKVNQIFSECQKLIDEGIPKEEILSILEKQIENTPEAKKLSRYWECLARLEQREGQPYNVIEVCENAVAAGAQPLEELRAILANTLEQLKTEPGEAQKKESEEEAQEVKAEVKPEPEDSAMTEKSKKGRRRAMKFEPKSPSTPEKPSTSRGTPEKGEDTSSVIRFNVTTTPYLEKMRKLQMREGGSSVKGYMFLTPVRRSSRLERKSHIFPDMLKDHDPCIAGIAQLENLEDPQSCPNAYIFRKNEALKEINAKSLTKE
ncbi:cytoskeleton-associated protein 2 [Rana temporaria]|uniref:cytoskeleton-associated protein 2 n=1 Tax=Rana temporaria TaxID=8407 RepID=UPI001AAD01A9|nr:cytoskeleton-associated protein 2 [Rana temporaria]